MANGGGVVRERTCSRAKPMPLLVFTHPQLTGTMISYFLKCIISPINGKVEYIIEG